MVILSRNNSRVANQREQAQQISTFKIYFESGIKKPEADVVNASGHVELNRSLELHLVASVGVAGRRVEIEFKRSHITHRTFN